MFTQESLENAFRKSLGLKPDVDVTTLAYGESEGWDSIAHMKLVAALEDAFDIMLETPDVIDMSNFKVAKEILQNNYDVRFES